MGPSSELAERFGIARETAARAHARLARAGYLVAVPGVGMVVTPVNRWPEEAI
jgi:DNA-binding GntR family transcriptional regulator